MEKNIICTLRVGQACAPASDRVCANAYSSYSEDLCLKRV